MVLLQHKLNVKLSQRQILTPGLVQMVSVLALNKLELKDMINAEMVENPVLEELEDAIPLLDDVGRQEEERDRIAAKATTRGRKSDHRRREEGSLRGDRFRLVLPGVSRPRLSQLGRNGRDREAFVRELPVEAGKSDRPPAVAAGRDFGAAAGTRGRRADHWQSERRRLPDCQRRGIAGNRSGCASRSGRRNAGQDRRARPRRWGWRSMRIQVDGADLEAMRT